MNARRLNLYAFLLSCGAISYFHMKKCKELPWPPRFIYTGITFLMLDIFALFNEELAGVTSVGFVIAIFVQQFSPQKLPGSLPGWQADCEHGGTGQPHTTAYLGNAQPPSTGSLQEYQQQQQQQGTAQAPGTTLV